LYEFQTGEYVRIFDLSQIAKGQYYQYQDMYIYYGPDPSDPDQTLVISPEGSITIPGRGLWYPGLFYPMEIVDDVVITRETPNDGPMQLRTYNLDGTLRYHFNDDTTISYRYLYGIVEAAKPNGVIALYDSYGTELATFEPPAGAFGISLERVLSNNRYILSFGEVRYLYEGNTLEPIVDYTFRESCGGYSSILLKQESNVLYMYEEDGTEQTIVGADINDALNNNSDFYCTPNYLLLSTGNVVLQVYDYSGAFYFEGVPISRVLFESSSFPEIILLENSDNEYFLVQKP
jgi:hypothetical protein